MVISSNESDADTKAPSKTPDTAIIIDDKDLDNTIVGDEAFDTIIIEDDDKELIVECWNSCSDPFVFHPRRCENCP